MTKRNRSVHDQMNADYVTLAGLLFALACVGVFAYLVLSGKLTVS
jgi:hypothetical protein